MYANLTAAKTSLESDIGDSILESDFIEWVNDWQDDYCAKITEARQDYFRTSGTLAIVAGTQSYALSGISPAPTRLIRVTRVENASSGRGYDPKPLNRKDYDSFLGWELEGVANIVWDPAPEESFSARIYFINWPAEFTSLSDTFSTLLPQHYIRRTLQNYLKYRYYDSEERGDDDTKAIRYLNIYNAILGEMLAELDNEEAAPEVVESIPDGLA